MGKTYKSFEAFQRDFKKSNTKIMKELKDTLPDIGDAMIEEIQKRTKLGYGVDDNYGSKSPLKKLSDAYKRQRKNMNLGERGKWNKSNLTLTGSMLESLKARTNKSSYTVTVRPTGSDEKGVSNARKAGQQEKDGRPFLYLSTPEIKRISKVLREALDKIVKRLF